MYMILIKRYSLRTVRSTFMDHQTVDINAMITDVLSAKHGYNSIRVAGNVFR